MAQEEKNNNNSNSNNNNAVFNLFGSGSGFQRGKMFREEDICIKRSTKKHIQEDINAWQRMMNMGSEVKGIPHSSDEHFMVNRIKRAQVCIPQADGKIKRLPGLLHESKPGHKVQFDLLLFRHLVKNFGVIMVHANLKYDINSIKPLGYYYDNHSTRFKEEYEEKLKKTNVSS